jgi:hypothetical protein
MIEDHKIPTVYKRDPQNKKHLLEGVFSLPELNYLKNNEWVFTEKVDGTNIRVMWDGKNVTFGGKGDNSQIPASLVTVLNSTFLTPDKKQMFETGFPNGVCLYGEGFGVGIQSGGKYIINGVNFILFDVLIQNWWLQRQNIEDIASKFGISVVPIIGYGHLFDMIDQTRTGFKSQWGDFIAEGIVARPVVELKSRNGDRIITKIKYKDFI